MTEEPTEEEKQAEGLGKVKENLDTIEKFVKDTIKESEVENE